MPYKNKAKQAEYLRKRGTQYHRERRKVKAEQHKQLGEALKVGNINLARELYSRKPQVHIFRDTWKDLSKQDKKQKK